MGIKGLKNFIESKLNILRHHELHDCNVLLDGNSIYHQMYKNCNLTCLFGGEYERFSYYCRDLFRSFAECRINVIVVFDGPRTDDRKLSTVLQRAKKRVDYSTRISVNIDLSPLLLRDVFINVLDQFNIPCVSGVGEADDECVSLANHLDCYLIADDSDYYCYSINRGYIPFDYLNVNPRKGESFTYLSSYLYTVDLLYDRFTGLNAETLALACGLCGNDYLSPTLTETSFSHITTAVTNSEKNQSQKALKTKHWFAFCWVSRFDNFESALVKLLEPIRNQNERRKFESQLRSAIDSYRKPTDTLIYRFASSQTNDKLCRNSLFNRMAEEFFELSSLNEEQIQTKLNEERMKLKTKYNHFIPADLIDGITNLSDLDSFIEVLMHRRLICSCYVEVESEPSVHEDAFPLILPCLEALVRWDHDEPEPPTLDIHHRVLKRFKRCIYPLFDHEFPAYETLDNLSIEKKKQWMSQWMKIPIDQQERFDQIHSDYSLWFRILAYWYSIRELTPTYLYAIVISFIKMVYLQNSNDQIDNNQTRVEPFSQSIVNEQTRSIIESNLSRVLHEKFKSMTKNLHQKNYFDCGIIHEFNCLQSIYKYTMKINDFFHRPFEHFNHPEYFLCGSFFYAFVENYEKKRNLTEAIRNLLAYNDELIDIVEKFLSLINLN